MILYHHLLNWDLGHYGIEVPLLNDRAALAFQSLSDQFPQLKEFDFSGISKLGKESLLLAHDEDFVKRLLDAESIEREIINCYELIDENGQFNRYNPKKSTEPLSKLGELLLQHCAVSSYAIKLALEKGWSYFLGGGLHHAMSFGGRGFCLINDVVIGIRKLQKENPGLTAWVIDVDVHKGCGTAEMTKDDPSIQTLSIHMAHGWPLDGPKRDESGNLFPWYLPSTVDIAIGEGEEEDYLPRLEEGLNSLLKSSGKKPDLAVIVQGADPYEEDELESSQGIKLSLEAMLERDKLVENWLSQKEIPRAYTMGGGYGKNSWKVYAKFFKWIAHKKINLLELN
jgi:acetoin utilization deacetylase AcuC-like enzyme